MVGKSSDRAFQTDDAIEAIGASFRVAEDEAAPLRIGDFDEPPGRIARQSDEFPAWRFDLDELTLVIEGQLPSAWPSPQVFLAVCMPTNGQSTVRRIAARAEARFFKSRMKMTRVPSAWTICRVLPIA